MEDPIVQIGSGLLRGKVTELNIGERVYAFLGIPYAKPPVGDLRFKAPQPEEPWSGIRNATKPGDNCYQKDVFLTKQVSGSEDCLYLNVFTKEIEHPKSLRPVMVFIHGGAFLTGSGDPEIQCPNFLLAEDIVYVSINYRLGVFGFLRLENTSLGIPGNAGLKDQVLALKWVQKNIMKFGGDPGNVTIFGVSAGSASVNYHLLSPSSKGLFHKAILQSGSVLNPWPHLHPQYLNILKYLKLENKTDENVLEALLKMSPNELIEAQNELYSELKQTFRIFAPCVEQPNDSAFITRNPIDIIRSGDYNKVPMIVGYNSNEGLLFTVPQYFAADLISDDEFIPPQIVFPENIEAKGKILDEIRKVYQLDINPDNKYLAISDSLFVAGIIALVRNFVETNSNSIYLYEFDYVGSRNILRTFLKIADRYKGACHGDDIGYIFDSNLFEISPKPNSMDDTIVRTVVKLWVNFAKYGNPTPDKQQFDVKWMPAQKDNLFYLHIDKELTIKSSPNAERMMLWREIYNSNNQTKDFMP